MEDEGSRDTRRTTAVWAAVTVLGVIAGYVGVLLANARHFYTDDTEAQYVPLWLTVGRHLRDGAFPGLEPERWMAGNYLVEGQASLFNPPQLLVAAIAPSFDNMVVLATVVKLAYSIILALGVFRICLAYRAQPPWAAVAGVAFCFSGWLLFLDQASWALGLVGTAWLAHAWASGVRYARGQSGPIPVFVFLYFTITIGYVWPGVEAAVMIVAVAAGEWVYQRTPWPSLRLLLAAGCAGLAGAITYLPSLLSSDATWRVADGAIRNDGFMTVPWSESLNASLPTTLPSFNSWFGLIQPFPVVYIAWFLIPGLAFIDWKAAAKSAREISGIAFFALITLVWTAGPATLGPLRWPARVLPMLALALLVLGCVLLSRHGSFANWRTRVAVAVGLVALLWVRSVASAPYDRIRVHLVAALVVIVLGAVVALLYAKWGRTAACAALLVTIAPIAYYQVNESFPHPMSWNLPESRSEAKARFPDFDGTTLQLGNSQIFPGDAKNSDGVYTSLVVGFSAEVPGVTYVNGYTPIGNRAFSERTCMFWEGSTCAESFGKIFEIEPATGKPIVDLMKVDRITLMRLVYPDARWQPPPPGWHWVDYPPNDKWIWVLERDGGPISTDNGRIADVGTGVDAVSTAESGYTSTARVSSETGGRVTFARLAWPGYRATLDGRDLDVEALDDIFVSVTIPPGTENAHLEVTWRPPGMYLGATILALGLTGIGLLHWWFVRNRRRPESADTHPADEPPVPTDAADTDTGRAGGESGKVLAR
ncbi:hypothetical protein BOX37_27210 [Nocardia mangyaensis]|uniref:YfhO family protein n=1 Tax=Nocardia mangyaensis TaxID=2213200 RepID=A0A1J0VYC2_9NOCA|nr:hypothetical protein [Nocardia mangyaensis]APE37005.1 hypothetical protein BOX37_27210 [Nocardia mangyaensis]